MSTIALPYAPPYDWPAMLAFLAARAVPTVEVIAEGRYRRNLLIQRNDAATAPAGRAAALVGRVEVRDDPARHRLLVTLSPSLAAARDGVVARLARVFDVGCDPLAVGAALGPLAQPCPGLRLPGAADPFELTVRAILGQQVTVAAARTLATRLVARFGEPLAAAAGAPSHLFPTAAALAVATPDRLGELGIIRSRGTAIIVIARAIAAGELVLLPGADVPATLARLTAIAGIGPWTAHYIAMRCLGWTDAFPPRDVAVLKALGVTSPGAAAALAERWRPWRAYAVLHLWRQVAVSAPASGQTPAPAPARAPAPAPVRAPASARGRAPARARPPGSN
ncbi:MAG: AlkA N-terminal domain-containing protein [Lautropia sp.]